MTNHAIMNKSSSGSRDPLAEYPCSSDMSYLGKGALICGDMLQELRKFQDDTFKTVVTSPPYNLKNSTGNGMKDGRGGKWPKASLIEGYHNHHDQMPHDDYVQWQRDGLTEMMRVLRPDGAIFYNHKNSSLPQKPMPLVAFGKFRKNTKILILRHFPLLLPEDALNQWKAGRCLTLSWEVAPPRLPLKNAGANGWGLTMRLNISSWPGNGSSTPVQAISEGIVVVDFDMKLRANGTVRNHGTKFRIYPKNLGLLYHHSQSFKQKQG